ncbi:MAG TPA: apolipoprotein N-acyltransferase [Mariprofundaceae bacterium]|nr:apolipoprotein N-acyltransferase [Mariprofundaceae bacterium]
MPAPWQLPVRLATALLLGSLMPFAFAPYGHDWLGVLALAGWVALLRERQLVYVHANRNRGFLIGFAFGFGWFGFGAWWLADTFTTYGHLPYALSLFCVALVGAALALFPGAWGWAASRLSRNHYDMLLLFPTLGMLEEWLRGHLFTGLPWTALGDLVLDTPAVGWASITGVYGATLLPTLAAAALTLTFSRFAWKAGLAGLAAIAILTAVAPSCPDADGPERQVVLVQPNIPQDVKWDAAFLNETMQRLARLSQSSAYLSDVIVWPEAAVPFFLSEAPDWRQWLLERMQRWDKPVLFGGLKLLGEDRKAQNGLYLFEPGAKELAFAGKQHLVPFGEYVPSWLPWLHKLVPDIGDFLPADDSGVLKSSAGHFGTLVCYESIFPEQARKRVRDGADVLVVVTNDAWYGRSPAAWQHFEAARMRAVETGRYVLRAANTGVTGIIAPDGHIVANMPWWTTGVLHGTYRTSTHTTLYQRFGDWVAASLVLALAAGLAWLWRRR